MRLDLYWIPLGAGERPGQTIVRFCGRVFEALAYAVESPVRLTDSPSVVKQVLDSLAGVPTPVWGRDEFGAGEMWNSNSVIAWALARSGLEGAAGVPPRNGRAPGWASGIAVATGRCGYPDLTFNASVDDGGATARSES